jgi:hypothetical protein
MNLKLSGSGVFGVSLLESDLDDGYSSGINNLSSRFAFFPCLVNDRSMVLKTFGPEPIDRTELSPSRAGNSPKFIFFEDTETREVSDFPLVFLRKGLDLSPVNFLLKFLPSWLL